MRAARIVVLAVALGASGIPAYLASGSSELPPTPAPAVQIDTVDILVARADIDPVREDDGTNRRLNVTRFGISTSATTK